MNDTALVLGGGGVAGIGWMTGLLLGLDLRPADRIVGTSAGATVAAQITSGIGLPALFERQVDPALQGMELVPHPHLFALMMQALPVLVALGDPEERTRRIGHLALEASTVSEAERRGVIEGRLPRHDWPDVPLTLVAVDTATGETTRFERGSGVLLVDAVAASCAVPGIWPPMTIDGRRYMDGGIRSSDNADLALGCGRVLVVSPLGTQGPSLGRGVADQVAELEQGGASVRLIEPDTASRAAMGHNPLAPETRAPAAQAGLAQGRGLADGMRAFWEA